MIEETKTRLFEADYHYSTWHGGIQFKLFGKWIRIGSKRIDHKSRAWFEGTTISCGFKVTP